LVPECSAAGATREVRIEFRDGVGYVFKEGDADITIMEGDTVEWVPELGGHRMVPDTPNDAFKETGIFNKDHHATQVFDTSSNTPIHYHCTFHPELKGSIKVEPAGK